MKPIMMRSKIWFEGAGRGSRKKIRTVDGSVPAPLEPGRVPRVSRFMALAVRFDQLIRSGEVHDYSEIAELTHVTRARVTQIMNLRMLAPDIQEAILFLPCVEVGRDSIHLYQLQPIALTVDWRKQRQMWKSLVRQ